MMYRHDGVVTAVSESGLSVTVKFRRNARERVFRIDGQGRYLENRERLYTAAQADQIMEDRERRSNRIGETRWVRTRDVNGTGKPGRWTVAEMGLDGWRMMHATYPCHERTVEEGPLIENRPGPDYVVAPREDELAELGVQPAAGAEEAEEGVEDVREETDQDEDGPSP